MKTLNTVAEKARGGKAALAGMSINSNPYTGERAKAWDRGFNEVTRLLREQG